jgi:hypothetical protein
MHNKLELRAAHQWRGLSWRENKRSELIIWVWHEGKEGTLNGEGHGRNWLDRQAERANNVPKVIMVSIRT